MKLHSMNGKGFMAKAHDNPIAGSGSDLQAFWKILI